MQRREFFAVLGATATVTLAGCLGGDDGSDDDSADGSSDDGSDDSEPEDGSEDDGETVPDYDADAAIETLRTYVNAQELETAQDLLHSSSTAEPSTVGEIVEQEYEALEENIDRDRLAELIGQVEGIDESALDAIAEGVVVVIEADVVLEFGGEQTEDVQQWVLARENGEWRVVERAIGY